MKEIDSIFLPISHVSNLAATAPVKHGLCSNMLKFPLNTVANVRPFFRLGLLQCESRQCELGKGAWKLGKEIVDNGSFASATNPNDKCSL